MALQDRIRPTVDAAVDQLRTRIEGEVRSIVDALMASAAEEQKEALIAARQAAFAEAAEDTRRQIEEAEARLRTSIEQSVASAREVEREQDAIEMRKLIELEANQKLSEALDAADTRMRLALADAEMKAAEALKASVAEARVREREAEMAGVTRLLDSIRGLDGATSLSEVLDALGQAIGREASRAAVFVLRNERLLGWKLSGFGSKDKQPKSIDLGLTEGGVIGLAVGAARPATSRDSLTAAAGPGFTHLPADRMGFAVPVIVGGRVVAVVYADSVTEDGREHTVPSGWPEVIEILARHAARCLEALTVQKAATTPSPRFWVPPAGQPGAAATAGLPNAAARPAAPAPATSSTQSAADTTGAPGESDAPRGATA